MSNGNTKKLKLKVVALERNTAALFKLLGGGEDDRNRFWEILKGITTPAVFRLVDRQLDGMNGLVNEVQGSVKALEQAAKEMR